MRTILRKLYNNFRILLLPKEVKISTTTFLKSRSSSITMDKSSVLIFEGSFSLCKFVTIFLNEGSEISIGKKVYIGDYSTVRAGRTKINIGDDTIIGQHVKIIATNHAYHKKDMLIRDQDIILEKIGITIGSDCWIGAGACILPGVILGNGVVVGANSVVTKCFPDYAVIAGVPAKIIKFRE